MPKTRISKEETINICHYFACLKSTYSISLTQLVETCPLEAKTIARYTSNDTAPNHALTDNTLENLITAFENILERNNIPIPHELSKEFLLSNQLKGFLDSETSTSDVNDDATITTAKTVILCDPKKNPMIILFMFFLGAFIFLVSCIEEDFFPQLFTPWLYWLGVICFTVAITCALPYLAQPLEVRPELQDHKHLLLLLSYAMQISVLILSIAKPLMCISCVAFLIALIF